MSVFPYNHRTLAEVDTEPLSRADQFAEYLADGHSIPEIRELMGITNGAAQGLMCRIRKGLGWQAQ